MKTGELLRELRGHVLVLTLNRPDARNALTPSLMNAIGSAIADAERDTATRVVVLTGSGEKAFCAGMDLRAFAAGETMSFDDEAGQAFARLLRGEVALPVIGAANGTALAGGLELLLGCDVIVLGEEAKLGLPEVKRGLIPGGSGTMLGTRIPLAIALEMNLTGESIDSARAYQIGLVNTVVASSQVLETALSIAERIASNGPVAVTAVKELVRLAVFDAPQASNRLAELRPGVFNSEDAREGAQAFIEKRAPVWQGR
jgi:enoyl-CoA hydratase/carnithine racemase